MRTVGAATLAAWMLAGCVPDVPGRGAVAPGPLFAPGRTDGAALVDPVVVGDRLMQAGEPELALDAYIRAAGSPAEITPDLRMAMAEANIALGRLSQAERLLREVVAEAPRNAEAWNNLGVVLLERGETGEAHICFKTAFALQPLPEIRKNLRVSAARLMNIGYDPETTTFTLTRRTNGAYGLIPPS